MDDGYFNPPNILSGAPRKKRKPRKRKVRKPRGKK